ncbi:MAG: response regulator [Deltaproteobacteria bacterium]|nr:response regulator [Deltaproteobacteria bacterium]
MGTHEGMEFIVMERIFGVSLSRKIAERRAENRPIALTEALRYLTAIADGLAVVHRAGLAHRDVKPENMMLTPDGRVVLMDFGLVVPEYDSELRGFVAGSPPYMAPETLRDRVSKGGGPLVDIYALGATCFEVLTFETPYASAESINHLFAMHLEGKIPSVGEKRAEVPLELDQLIQEMLAKDPANRPQSAQGIAWQLKGIATRLAEPLMKGSMVPQGQRTLDVLIVEDDDALARIECFYIEELFGKDRVRLRRAHDGQEAIDHVRRQAPDLLLLDLHLPKLNGIEVGMQIRGDDLAPETKIVAVSAGAQERDLQLLHLLGFHHFVPKGEGMKDRLAEALQPLFPDLLDA